MSDRPHGRPLMGTLAATLAEEAAAGSTSPGPDELRGTITMLTGQNAGAVFPLEHHVMLIGRAPDCDVCVADDGLSRTHARIYRSGGQHYIEDLKSTNGTYVRGARIDQPVPLDDGTRIKVGKRLILSFSLQDELQQRATQRLYEQTVRDGLTGLYNRRYLEDRLRTELAYAKRHENPVAVLMLDIDHFKSINDSHGHQAGDAVLVRFGEMLGNTVRIEDLAARYGGEEFIVVAREGLEGAMILAERVRALVASTEFEHAGQRIEVTVSVGVAHNSLYACETGHRLVAAADEALYRAKEGGRDRVCRAG